ncbi:Uncharacterised protein [Vibrio cholerae]|nr:Uncharacterised protein [Vibrio cholerae]
MAIRRQVLLRGNRIFCFQIKAMQIRQHTNHRFTGFLLQPIKPRLQQANVAAKAVNHKAFYPRLLRLRKQRQGAV